MPARTSRSSCCASCSTGEIKTRATEERRPGALIRRDARSSRSARYQNRAIEAAQVIEELIQLAKEMREADAARRRARADGRRTRLLRRAGNERQRRRGARRREPYGLIARELVETVRKNVTIDWTMRENVRASCACWSSASSASTATRRTSRRRRRRRCWSRRSSCRGRSRLKSSSGPPFDSQGDVTPSGKPRSIRRAIPDRTQVVRGTCGIPRPARDRWHCRGTTSRPQTPQSPRRIQIFLRVKEVGPTTWAQYEKARAWTKCAGSPGGRG